MQLNNLDGLIAERERIKNRLFLTSNNGVRDSNKSTATVKRIKPTYTYTRNNWRAQDDK